MLMPNNVHIHDDSPVMKDCVLSALDGYLFIPVFHNNNSGIITEIIDKNMLCRIIPYKNRYKADDDIKLYSSKNCELVIMYSPYNDLPSAVHSIKLGAFDFLRFPFNPFELVSALKRASSFKQEQSSQLLEISSIKSKLTRLTLRENVVLDNILMCKRNKIIAFELKLSQRTVENHRASIMAKMEARSITDLVTMINKINTHR